VPLPTITGIARLVADPELNFTQSGAPVANLRLAFNSRRQDAQGNWVDGDTFWVRAVAWKNLAENVAETLTKGMEVTVTGELKTESWEKDGQKHSQPSLTIRAIGPNLAFSVATVSKAPSAQQGGGGQGQRAQQRPQAARQQAQPPTDDPWATGATEPPF
jgi:single-strand DNA-binding protein